MSGHDKAGEVSGNHTIQYLFLSAEVVLSDEEAGLLQLKKCDKYWKIPNSVSAKI